MSEQGPTFVPCAALGPGRLSPTQSSHLGSVLGAVCTQLPARPLFGSGRRPWLFSAGALHAHHFPTVVRCPRDPLAPPPSPSPVQNHVAVEDLVIQQELVGRQHHVGCMSEATPVLWSGTPATVIRSSSWPLWGVCCPVSVHFESLCSLGFRATLCLLLPPASACPSSALCLRPTAHQQIPAAPRAWIQSGRSCPCPCPCSCPRFLLPWCRQGCGHGLRPHPSLCLPPSGLLSAWQLQWVSGPR
ncbi:uncharacterized protein LOC116596191 [Mustela erminea]|uniref:uncharacterized protein LOC116596191 n=1 Tax=Mustela erminea TaxID=36723 RepID=UPI0013872EC8|nr:uncharacterized protein LOC116596191 [Mustela erminea]